MYVEPVIVTISDENLVILMSEEDACVGVYCGVGTNYVTPTVNCNSMVPYCSGSYS